MKDFLLLYRLDESKLASRSPEELQANTQRWMDWMGNIAAQNKLTARGERLHTDGKVIRRDHVITDGPYTELKEQLGGYSIVKAASLEEATALAKDCPIFFNGGSVEVREIIVM